MAGELLYYIDEQGLLHGPSVHHKLLVESGDQGTQSNSIIVCHTMVGYLLSTHRYFSKPEVTVESTVGIGGKYDAPELDGAIYQWMLFTERADAQYQGNPYCASIENSDGGGTRYKERFSPKQAEANAQVLAAWCVRYKRPVALIRRTRVTEYGIGYHRQGVDPYRLLGDDKWSLVYSKECPGFERSRQLEHEIIPRAGYLVRSHFEAISQVDTQTEEDEPLFAIMPLSGTDFDDYEEAVIGLPWQGGVTGVNKVWVQVSNSNSDLNLKIAHWRVVSEDGKEYPVDFAKAGTVVGPLSAISEQAPERATHLILDYNSELGACVTVEAK